MRNIKTPEERKAEMVAIAAGLFARQGFLRTSVSEITDTANVAKGLFYYYFTTKDDMVKAVVEGYCSYLGTVAERVAQGEGSAREKLLSLFSDKAWRERFTEPLMHDLCIPQSTVLYCDLCDRMAAHIGPALEQIFAQGLEENGLPADNVHSLTRIFLYGFLMENRTGELHPEAALNMVAELLHLPALSD